MAGSTASVAILRHTVVVRREMRRQEKRLWRSIHKFIGLYDAGAADINLYTCLRTLFLLPAAAAAPTQASSGGGGSGSGGGRRKGGSGKGYIATMITNNNGMTAGVSQCQPSRCHRHLHQILQTLHACPVVLESAARARGGARRRDSGLVAGA